MGRGMGVGPVQGIVYMSSVYSAFGGVSEQGITPSPPVTFWSNENHNLALAGVSEQGITPSFGAMKSHFALAGVSEQ